MSRDRNIPDAMQHSKYVLLVTDGAPTCKVDVANGTTSGPDEANTYAAVTAKAVSCSYVLENAPGDPRFVRVAIDGQSYPLGSAWELSDETTVSLLGPACDVLRDGRAHALEITVEREPVEIF